MSCPVCLEILFSDEVAEVLCPHLEHFLRASHLAFAYSDDRRVALQQYTTLGIGKAKNALTRRLIQKGLSTERAKECLDVWRLEADLGMEPTKTNCGHSFHRRCASRLFLQSYDSSPSTPFASLPKVPRTVYGGFQCPVCRTQTLIDGLTTYDEDQLSDTTIGPYRLKKKSLVWMYSGSVQPGHPEAGSLGRLVGYGPNKTHLVVQNIMDEVEGIKELLPAACVFDLAFLATLGIPRRDLVASALKEFQEPAPAIIEDWFSVSDACSASKSSGEQRWVQLTQDRKDYITRLFREQEHVKREISAYFQSPLISALVGKAATWTVDIEEFWRFKILPRLGMLGMEMELRVPLLPSTPVPFPLLEFVAQKTSLPLELCNILLRYASGGYLVNRGSAPEVVALLKRVLSHPQNAKWAAAFRLPQEMYSVGQSPPPWAVSLHLWSCHEVERVRQWRLGQGVVTILGTAYLIHQTSATPQHLLSLIDECQKSGDHTALSKLLSVHASVLPRQSRDREELCDTDLPLVYSTLSYVKREIDKLRETCASVSRQSRDLGATGLGPSGAGRAREGLSKIRDEVLEKHALDIYRVGWFELPGPVQEHILQYRPVATTPTDPKPRPDGNAPGTLPPSTPDQEAEK